MLMAAGLGTRLRPFSEHVAKPLIPVLGVPCAQFAVDSLVASGVTRIVANVHHLSAPTREGLQELDLGGASLVVSDESKRLLGSGGGIAKALGELAPGPFFITNADVMCSIDWSALARTHARLRSMWNVGITLAVMPIPPDAEEPYRALEIDADFERIVGLGEKSRTGWMYIGCAVVEPELFVGLSSEEPFEFVPRVLEPAIASGRAGVHRFDGRWLDMGSPGSWWRAHLKLLDELETGTLPAAWRERIERSSRRVASRCWVSRRVRLWSDASGWRAPFFWDPQSTGAHRGGLSREVGPSTILYGDLPQSAEGSGIGAYGIWSPQDLKLSPG